MHETISLGHGSGGKLTHDLISNLFLKHFNNKKLLELTDSAVLQSSEIISFTTDSYVVDPIFFPGGDIGKLAVCGTVNDLSVSGAEPKYISTSFIIEEGFFMHDLETIVKSMAKEAKRANVLIVTGDTKIVNRGKCDKVFINTSGVGFLSAGNKHISLATNVKSGDKIIINGKIGEHGIAVMSARESLSFASSVKSDCASLNHLIKKIVDKYEVKFMRDATRGGVATVLCELVEKTRLGIEIIEDNIPVDQDVTAACEIFGYDPLYLANEGKVIMVVENNDADEIIKILKKDQLGTESAIIGEIVDDHKGMALLNTSIGGRRIIDMLAGEQLPRIC